MTTEHKNGITSWIRDNLLTIVLIIGGFVYTQIDAKAQIENAIKTQRDVIEEMKEDIKEIQRDIKQILKEK